MDRLNHTLSRLVMDCMGTSDFTNLLDTEIRRSMPPARDFNPRRVLQKQSRKMLPARDLNNTGETSDSFRECSWRRSSAHTTLSVLEVPSAKVCWATRMVQLSTTLDGSDSDFSGHDFFYISHREYVPRMVKISLLIAKENIRRAFVRLIYMAGGLPPPKTGRIWWRWEANALCDSYRWSEVEVGRDLGRTAPACPEEFCRIYQVCQCTLCLRQDSND